MKKPSIYKELTKEQKEELSSNYLIDSWSFSKINTFSRNEKVFEMNYVYCIKNKRSATEVAGSAYHKVLNFYFTELKEGISTDIIDLQAIAFDYIYEIFPNIWKLQKTTPTIEECQKKAVKVCNALISNFLSDISIYTSELKEVIEVELYIDEFLTINGVDIPLPCHGQIDLVIKTNNDKIVIIDHKSKTSFTDEKELKFTIGKQAITYSNLYETSTGLNVDEVWFVENKSSENKDKSPQLNCFKVELNSDNRKLYESLLYEPLKRTIDAVANPDYIYLVNDNDNFVDKAELYDFWARTMIAEVDDYNVPLSKKDLIEKRLKKIRNASVATIDPKIIKKFRENASEFIQYDLSNKDMTNEQKIEHTMRTLGLIIQVPHTFKGYSSDTFLIDVSAGTNLASVQRYKMDIASALNVPYIRMSKELFIHEGKAYLAVEASKQKEEVLYFDAKYANKGKIPIGIDNFNNTIYWDLFNPSTPHVLVCGSTGSGKSVCLVSIIEYALLSEFDSIVILDSKYSSDFIKYNSTKNISVYNDIEEIETMMELMVNEMNDLVKTGKRKKTLVIFDEFADAVANARSGSDLNVYENVVIGSFKDGREKTKREVVEVKKSLEENLRILLQKGRSVGYRIVAATQRASVKVITGDAKVNFPVQICFRVPKEVDSKVVLDEAGAESLTGKGDGLIKSPDYNGVVRFQGFYKA